MVVAFMRHNYANQKELRSGQKGSQQRLMRGDPPRMARAPIGRRPICVWHDLPKSVSQLQTSSR
jgi:hypothetical protein